MLSLAAAKRDGTSTIYIYDSYSSESKERNILIADKDRIISNILFSRYKNKGYIVSMETKVENVLEMLGGKNIEGIIKYKKTKPLGVRLKGVVSKTHYKKRRASSVTK